MQEKRFDFRQILYKYNLAILLLIFISIASLLSPAFLTFSNLVNILQNNAPGGIMALGMTFVVITGGIDLSVGSVSALAGMLMGLLLTNDVPLFAAVLIAVMSGAAIGAVTGFVISRFELPAFIVSLAVMVSARGLTLLTTDGRVIAGLASVGPGGAVGEAFRFLGAGRFLGLPFNGITWFILTLLAAFILKKTLFGRSLYAIGGNKESAFLSGIKMKKYTNLAYIISGACAAYAGVVLTAWLTVSQPTLSAGAELDAIAAVVLGGTALSGGTGGVVGTFGGVLLMAIINNIFNLIGLPSFYQQIFMGIIIVAALLLNRLVIVRQKQN